MIQNSSTNIYGCCKLSVFPGDSESHCNINWCSVFARWTMHCIVTVFSFELFKVCQSRVRIYIHISWQYSLMLYHLCTHTLYTVHNNYFGHIDHENTTCCHWSVKPTWRLWTRRCGLSSFRGNKIFTETSTLYSVCSKFSVMSWVALLD